MPFEDISHIEMAVKAAEEALQTSTMTMESEKLLTVNKAFTDAKKQLEMAKEFQVNNNSFF